MPRWHAFIGIVAARKQSGENYLLPKFCAVRKCSSETRILGKFRSKINILSNHISSGGNMHCSCLSKNCIFLPAYFFNKWCYCMDLSQSCNFYVWLLGKKLLQTCWLLLQIVLGLLWSFNQQIKVMCFTHVQ